MATIFGRERELLSVDSAVRRGLGGAGALLLFSGEPGIGKTLLAEHAAAVANELGAQVAWGRCWEAGGAPAYWPWVQAFRSLGLAEPFHGVEAGESPADARFRAFDQAAQLLQGCAKKKALLVVLDDLHAADLPSLLLLQLLARGLRGHALVVVGTFREVEARRDRDVAAVLAKLGREGESLALRRLAVPDIAAWLAQVEHDAAADEVFLLTEGNPLFVREVLRLGGRAQVGRLPVGMAGVLDEHLARVSVEVRRVLEEAAILGRELHTVELQRLVDIAPTVLNEALSEAVTADLLDPDERGRFSFVHMLVRDRLVEQLSPSRRAELNCRAAEVIIETRADLVSAAHHLLEGHLAAPLERVLSVVRDAAERCLTQLAFEAAVELAERALALVPSATSSRAVCALLVVAAEAHLRAGGLARGKERCMDAARMAKALGESELSARAALAYGASFVSASVDPVMVELLDGALGQLGDHDHPLRARIMARLASALVPPRPADVERVLTLGRGAVAMARRLNDPETLLYTLQYAASGFGYQIGADERMALCEEILALAERLGNRTTLLQVLGVYAVNLLEQGRRAEAFAVYARHDQLLEYFPQPAYQWRRYSTRATLAALKGDYAGAMAASDELHAYALAHDLRSALMAWSLSRISLAHAWGDPARLADCAEEVLGVLTKVPSLAPYTAWVLAAVGRPAESRQLLDQVTRDAAGFPWLISAADTVVLLGARDLAEHYLLRLPEHRFKNRLFWGPAASFGLGPTSRILGDLSMLLERPQAALGYYEDALEFSERIGALPFIELSRRGRDAARAALAGGLAEPARALTLRREGDVWAIEWQSACVRLKDSKGLRYLERLVASVGQDVHVLDLIGSEERAADAGAVLDATAKEQYRRRLGDLRDQLEEATRLGDSGRAERAQTEIDAIADGLASAVGLGGRDRLAASNVEKARINVQRRLRDLVERVSEQNQALGIYLERAIRTGTFCSFSAAERN